MIIDDNTTCVVCKRKIENEQFQMTSHGIVHQGHCLYYIEQMPLNESTDSDLDNVELIL